MHESHLQSRALTDALHAADGLLRSRHTSLAYSAERVELEMCFAKEPYGSFFRSTAYTAAEFPAMLEVLEKYAPELAAQLERPAHPNDIGVLGITALHLRFEVSGEAMQVPVRLANGRTVEGASLECDRARLYTSGTVALPTEGAEWVYFSQLPAPRYAGAAAAASKVFEHIGDVAERGARLTFPVAETSRVPDYSWVFGLRSRCGLYAVRNVLSVGKARVDMAGFLANEVKVLQVAWYGGGLTPREVVIDGPFLVFFANEAGVHAAAWFNGDSFSDWKSRAWH